jgi:hypothetical protein
MPQQLDLFSDARLRMELPPPPIAAASVSAGDLDDAALIAAIPESSLDDLDRTVAKAAACALGRMGRTEARPLLKRWLRDEPCEDVVEAASSVADAECVVLLGRIARSIPSLADAARDALEEIGHPDAGAPAGTIRRLPVSHGHTP